MSYKWVIHINPLIYGFKWVQNGLVIGEQQANGFMIERKQHWIHQDSVQQKTLVVVNKEKKKKQGLAWSSWSTGHGTWGLLSHKIVPT